VNKKRKSRKREKNGAVMFVLFSTKLIPIHVKCVDKCLILHWKNKKRSKEPKYKLKRKNKQKERRSV
jgi:hypothetical protein